MTAALVFTLPFGVTFSAGAAPTFEGLGALGGDFYWSWADGISGFSVGPSPEEVKGQFELARSAWKEEGRE